MDENGISHGVIGAGIEVHRQVGGPGLLESVYEDALVRELEDGGLRVERQVPCPIHYKGRKLATPLRLDLIVEDLVVAACKATSEHYAIFEAQRLTYPESSSSNSAYC